MQRHLTSLRRGRRWRPHNRTFHRDLLYEIVEAVADVAVPVGDLDYDIPDPWAYYIENSTVYAADDPRRHEHIEKLKQKILPDNLFTCAALVLRKMV